MCDYSLYVFSNRLARDGEELVAYRFSSGCIGFVSASDMSEAENRKAWLGQNWPQLKTWLFPRQHNGPTAVCIPPGAQLTLERVERELRQRLGLEESEQAAFIQVTANEFSYRDGLRFRDAQQILLQELPPGQHARIISTSGLQIETGEPSYSDMTAYD
jgi:hypothetical protein